MALTNQQEGSQAATVTTEHQLGTEITAGGIFILAVDLVNLVNGDVVELYSKTKVRSSGALQIAYKVVYAHTQKRLNVYSPPIPADVAIDFYLKQTAGTGRTFPWKILGI